MKATLALLLLIVAAFAIKDCCGHDEIVLAPDCSAGDGTYPDPSFCEMFFQCVNGVAYSFSCPRTTVFNPNTSLCDSQFMCEFKCPLEDGIYSDPKNCEKFFFCRDRTAIEMKCPEEAPVFNPELRVCDSRSNYPCGHAPDHGGWSDWSHWSNCSLPCGNGTSTRVRTCDNPSPVNNGNECQGPANETKLCNTHSCPVVDQCAENNGTGPCHKDVGICNNTKGGYTCECKSPYQGDGKTCEIPCRNDSKRIDWSQCQCPGWKTGDGTTVGTGCGDCRWSSAYESGKEVDVTAMERKPGYGIVGEPNGATARSPRDCTGVCGWAMGARFMMYKGSTKKCFCYKVDARTDVVTKSTAERIWYAECS